MTLQKSNSMATVINFSNSLRVVLWSNMKGEYMCVTQLTNKLSHGLWCKSKARIVCIENKMTSKISLKIIWPKYMLGKYFYMIIGWKIIWLKILLPLKEWLKLRWTIRRICRLRKYSMILRGISWLLVYRNQLIGINITTMELSIDLFLMILKIAAKLFSKKRFSESSKMLEILGTKSLSVAFLSSSSCILITMISKSVSWRV